MVDSRFLITVSRTSDRHPATMAASTLLGLPGNQLPHSNQAHQSQKNRKLPSNTPSSIKVPSCHSPHAAAVDVAILIAVLFASGFLLLPCLELFYGGFAGIGDFTLSVMRGELDRASAAYLCLVLSFLVLAVAIFGIFRCCSSNNRKCENPNCRGLRNAPEFDMQIETEECIKNSNCLSGQDDLGRGFFELNEDHHKELQAELKKIAPPNGRAILIFRAKCGCSAGRLVVWGPKKQRKIKK